MKIYKKKSKKIIQVFLVLILGMMLFMFKDPFSVKASVTLKAGISFSPAVGNLDDASLTGAIHEFYSHQSPYFIIAGGSDVYLKRVTLYIYNANGTQIYSQSVTPDNFYYANIQPETFSAGTYSYEWEYTVTTGDVNNDYFTAQSGKIPFTISNLTYTIFYSANGGSGAPSEQTKTHGMALTLSNTKPTRSGYTFKGWATSSTATSAIYQPGDSYTSNSSTALYAVWEKNPSAPIVTTPTDKSVKEGESATFTVSASGGNPSSYSYQWYYAESSTGTGTQISGATSSSYTITSSDMKSSLDGRYYYCVVSNGQYDVPSGRAKLTVQSDETSEANVPPTVSGLTEWYTIASGTSLDLEVNASGGTPDVYTYQWYYAESESGEGTKIDGAVSSKYTIPSLEVTVSINGRYYYCIVSNGAYHVESQRTRVFVYNETDQEPETGEDQNTETGEGQNSETGGNQNTETGGDQNSETGGNKTPLFSNLATQVIQASSYTKEYGSKAFFIQASTNGNGKLTYQSSDKKVATVSSKGKVTLKGYGTAVVTICASKTSAYKAASKQITIKVIPKKTALKKVNSPGSRRISLKWEKNGNIIGYEIYISTSKNFKTHTLKRTYPKSKTSIAITRLKSGKKYYVKIRSYTKVGKKKYKSNWSTTKQVKVK